MIRNLALCLLLCLAPVAATAPLPYQYFGNLPDISHITLSPDGSRIAAYVRIDVEDTQGQAVQITDLDTKKKKIVLFTDNSKY